MTHHASIDLQYRPSTYWPESENREQRLSHIQGEARRDITRKALEEGGIEALNIIGAEVATETLSNESRQAWGAMHPSLMGGEYLPDYEESDVEIARISLESVTADQICVLASGELGNIYYRVVDEYEEEYHLPITRSIEPLTLGELIRLLDETENPFNDAGGGLVRNHWLYNQNYMDPEVAVDFVSIASAFYPDLTEYFENEAACWLREQCDRLAELE